MGVPPVLRVLWFIALYTLIQPEQLPWSLLGKVAAFTVGVGFPGEFAKALAVNIFLYRSPWLFHACMAGITVFFIGVAYRYRPFRIGFIVFGLAFAAVLQ